MNAGTIFTPFFTTRRERGDVGMGLSIARALLQAQGGDLILVTGTGGTAFWISFWDRDK